MLMEVGASMLHKSNFLPLLSSVKKAIRDMRGSVATILCLFFSLVQCGVSHY